MILKKLIYLILAVQVFILYGNLNVFAVRAPISHYDVTDEMNNCVVTLVNKVNPNPKPHCAVIFEEKKLGKDKFLIWGTHFGHPKDEEGILCSPLIARWNSEECLERLNGRHQNQYSIIKSWNISSYKADKAKNMIEADIKEKKINCYFSGGNALYIISLEDTFSHNCASYAAKILKECGIYGLNSGLFRLSKSPNTLAKAADNAECKSELRYKYLTEPSPFIKSPNTLAKSVDSSEGQNVWWQVEQLGNLLEENNKGFHRRPGNEMRLDAKIKIDEPGILPAVASASLHTMALASDVKYFTERALANLILRPVVGVGAIAGSIIWNIAKVLDSNMSDEPDEFDNPINLYNSMIKALKDDGAL